ncbi:MAG: DUF2927 domain-containing protein [Pikeienuella sp.]
MIRAFLAALSVAVLAACAPVSPLDRTVPYKLAERPDYPGYGTGIATQDIQWNVATLAADFGELIYVTEWGHEYERLLRWEKPVTIAIEDPVVRAQADILNDLMARVKAVAPNLRATVSNGPKGDITIRAAPKSEMRKQAPTALCFFVPVDATWDQYVGGLHRTSGNWNSAESLEAITIFVPANAPPHVYRACIIEEVTQALGPRNDIYGLEDSIYNDDNLHTWPTAFDLLMIAVLYDPDLKPFVKRPEAERVAREAFASGRYGRIGTKSRKRHPKENRYLAYRDEFAAEKTTEKRYAVAQKLIELAKTFDRADHRRAEAQRRAGFVKYGAGDFTDAVVHFRQAVKDMRTALGENTPRFARVLSDLGLALMKLGNWQEADAAFGAAAPIMAAYGMDLELAHILHLKSITEFELGKTAEARATALQSIDWAAYVFGADNKRVKNWRTALVDLGPLG